MEYQIILIEEEEIDTLKNDILMCATNIGLAVFEPLPENMLEYFEGRERVRYISDWHFPLRPIRISIPMKLYVNAQREFLLKINHTNEKLYNLGYLIDETINNYLPFIISDNDPIITYIETWNSESDEPFIHSFDEIKIEKL